MKTKKPKQDLNFILKLLQKIEWNMGNGQCRECCGHRPGGWAPHPCVPTEAHEGHGMSCELGRSIVILGGETKFTVHRE